MRSEAAEPPQLAEELAPAGRWLFLLDFDGCLSHLVDEPEDARPADGWRLERKTASVALHHRMVTGDAVDLLPRTRARFFVDESDTFVVLDGHDVTELRPRATDKGVVAALLADRHPDHVPLSFGDDTTDEDAFRVAVARGGRAVLVATAPRETAATHRLTDPDAVVATLRRLADLR